MHHLFFLFCFLTWTCIECTVVLPAPSKKPNAVEARVTTSHVIRTRHVRHTRYFSNLTVLCLQRRFHDDRSLLGHQLGPARLVHAVLAPQSRRRRRRHNGQRRMPPGGLHDAHGLPTQVHLTSWSFSSRGGQTFSSTAKRKDERATFNWLHFLKRPSRKQFSIVCCFGGSPAESIRLCTSVARSPHSETNQKKQTGVR